MSLIKLQFVACGVVFVSTLATGSAQAATKTLTISKAKVERAINGALSRVNIHVDNLGARNGGSFLQQDSYVAVRLKGKTSLTTRFKVPEQSYTINKVGGRYLRFYVSDLNSNSLRARLDRKRGGNLLLNIGFESNGSEVQGRCVTRRGLGKRRKWVECRLDLDRNAQINNAKLAVWAPIVVSNGKLTLGQAKANFQSDVKLNSKLCGIVRKKCRDIENRVKGQIAAGVVGSVKSSFDRARGEFQKAIARLDRNFSRAGVRVTSLRDLGDRYRVVIRYPG